jgi:IclR family transcriptional regulator, acetate operon repressor
LDSPIQSIQRAGSILRSFNAADSELGVTRISELTGLHKSTVSRLLSALQMEGLVEQNPETGKYRLGLGLVKLAGLALERMDLRHLAHPYLMTLAEQTEETVNLTVLDGEECVNIERVASPRSIRYVGWIGRRTPLHCTSTGKVFLAYLSQAQRDRLLPASLPALTRHTITDRAILEEALRVVREQGYASAIEEFEEGLSAVAAPLRDRTGAVIGTVSVSGPSYRLSQLKLDTYVDSLREVANAVSNQLGHVLAAPRTTTLETT